MKKIYTLLPILFLTACVQTGDDYQTDDFYDEDNYNDETTYFTEEAYVFKDEPMMIDENTGLIVDEAVAVESVQQPVQPAVQSAPVIEEAKETTITVSDDGTKIIIPAQEIYIGNELNVVSANVQTRPTMAYSSPDQIPVIVQPKRLEKQIWVTLQNREHPNTFVQCTFEDINCITQHEQQGYIRVQGLPHFAGYQDILGSSDYPGEGQWRNGNNIPRW